MPKVIYEKDGRIGRITLNRPEVMNAIDNDVPVELADCVARANADWGVHVIVLSGAGEAFCAGYDLAYYAEASDGGGNNVTQEMPWDPMKDYAFMMRNTELFMSVWRSHRPVICKVHGYAVAGGSDIALCADMILMSADARIGYMPTRVWGCPTTAMWCTGSAQSGETDAVHRRQNHRHRSRKARSRAQGRAAGDARRPSGGARGEDGDRAGQPADDAEARHQPGHRGDGTEEYPAPRHRFRRHHPPLPRRLELKKRAETVGWKQAVRERDNGTWDWTENRPINPH